MTPPTPKRPGGTTLTERYQRAKTALAKADPFYTSEGFWKAFEEGGIDQAQVARVEAMAKSYRQRHAKGQSRLPKANDPIGQLLDKYDSGEIKTIQDLADEAEASLFYTSLNRSLLKDL